MKEGVVLFAHGSRDPAWSRPLERIADAVARRRPDVALVLAFLEHGPSLAAAVEQLVAQGARQIRVVPVFLGQGGHVKEDLPRLVAAAAGAHPGCALHLEPAIGEEPAIIEAIAGVVARH